MRIAASRVPLIGGKMCIRDSSKSLHRIWCGYFLFISVLISIIFTVDLGLYEYWGFRLDVYKRQKNVQAMLKLGRAQGVAMAAALSRDIGCGTSISIRMRNMKKRYTALSWMPWQ